MVSDGSDSPPNHMQSLTAVEESVLAHSALCLSMCCRRFCMCEMLFCERMMKPAFGLAPQLPGMSLGLDCLKTDCREYRLLAGDEETTLVRDFGTIGCFVLLLCFGLTNWWLTCPQPVCSKAA
eukprot:1938856-Amphidinium_carterae.1